MLQRNKKKVYVWFESGSNIKNGNRKTRVRLIWSEETIIAAGTEWNDNELESHSNLMES